MKKLTLILIIILIASIYSFFGVYTQKDFDLETGNYTNYTIYYNRPDFIKFIEDEDIFYKAYKTKTNRYTAYELSELVNEHIKNNKLITFKIKESK